MVNVTLLDAGDTDAYDAFLQSRAEATLYHSARYRELLLRLLPCRADYLVARRRGRIVGVLPLMRCDGSMGAVINSLPFFGSYGGVVAEDAAAAARLWAEFARLLDDPEIAAATVIDSPFAADAPGAEPSKSTFTDWRIGQFTRLDGDAGFGDRLAARIDGSARRNLRKAESSGVHVAVEPDAIDFLEACHRANMAEIGGRAKPAGFFAVFPALFRAGLDHDIYVARIDGEPVAALLIFYYKSFVEYFTPVTLATHREQQPMSAILYRAMCDAARRGCRLWNWGGTWPTQTGVYRFKRKWAAEEVRYEYHTTLKREALLAVSRAELTRSYPWFYVLPFAALAEAQPQLSHLP
ncbi:MAG TPA: GNAT family N-acetyltransferase [Stellaceae bacterium]|nr:GNAT family N-acetyltransferase [Stellaceae bacterium]